MIIMQVCHQQDVPVHSLHVMLNNWKWIGSHLHVDAVQAVKHVLEDQAVSELPPHEFYHTYQCHSPSST